MTGVARALNDRRIGIVQIDAHADLRRAYHGERHSHASVMQLLAEEGRTMLVVTHEMGFAREVSNQVIFLHQGLIEEQGDPRMVMANPRSERLARFLSGNLK